jgi:endonuclease YncB( thermonuclease family)
MQRTLGDRLRLRLLTGCSAAALGLLAAGGAWAQSSGLDMDVVATAPLVSTAVPHQSGGLDMDVNATASVTTNPMAAARPGANVQDGIVVFPPVQSAPAQSAPAQSAPAQSAPAETASTTEPAPTVQPTSPVAAPVLSPEPVRLDHPVVIDTAKLKAGDTTVTLFGIEGQTGAAAQGLQSFLTSTGDHLTCQPHTANGFVCLLPDGTDVAQAALVNGAARSLPEAPEAYREQESLAQAGRRGIWADLPPPPLVVKHPTVIDTATLATADGQKTLLDGVIGLGQPYAGELQSYIAANGDSLSCQPQAEPDHYVCVLNDGTDIAKVALVNGGARVAPDAPDAYRVQQGEALDNKRGFWLNPPADILLTATTVRVPACCAYAAGDEGSDGVAYAGGVPVAVIDGVSTFLVFGGAAGWGYYDATHHWHSAPARVQAHMQHYHPDATGLRGYHGGGVVQAHGTEPGFPHGTERGDAHEPGGAFAGGRQPGMAGAPGMFGMPGHQEMPSAFHMSALSGGFVHPSPSVGGFHPGGMPEHAGGMPMGAPHAPQGGHGGGGGGGGEKHR